MSRNYLTFFIIPFILLEVATAKAVVECNIVTGGTRECNPYSSRFVKAKEVKYDLDRKKLIVTKTLPVPEKKASVKVISVEDMIERYVKVEDSMRFKGDEPVPLEKRKKEIILTQIQKIKLARKKLFDKMQKFKEEKEQKRLEALVITEEEKKKELEKEETRLETLRLAEEEKKKALEEKRKHQGLYVIEKGDGLSTIAAKFGIKTNELRTLNNLEKKSAIRIGKKLTIPYNQKRVDSIARAEYIVEKGDSFGSIAKDFNLTSKAIIEHNRLKRRAKIRLGQKLRLPLPHALKKKRSKFDKKKFSKSFGRKKLRVTATAYSSHKGQTDKTPFLAAWNNRLRPGMKAIAVSRDMLTRYGMKNGTKVRIAGLPGYYRVKDKMNKRYRKRIDIYMGLNKRKALRWGRRSVVI
ncbi:MAG: LysM peptidoglycan-binding domain-containing protein, partial [Campylobacterota bacterium]|nr:LysM peptidoglycan-binding domain-containing protein [Campylobacterota bacterium]